MKRNKWFTLIEIVITIVIIGIVLAMVTNLGSWFSDKIRFANTKERFASSIQNTLQEASTTNSVHLSSWWVKYWYLSLGVLSGTSLQATYGSGELVAPFSREILIDRALVTTSGFHITLIPYAVGCTVHSGASLQITSTENTNFHACYSVAAATCKLQEVVCTF